MMTTSPLVTASERLWNQSPPVGGRRVLVEQRGRDRAQRGPAEAPPGGLMGTSLVITVVAAPLNTYFRRRLKGRVKLRGDSWKDGFWADIVSFTRCSARGDSSCSADSKSLANACRSSRIHGIAGLDWEGSTFQGAFFRDSARSRAVDT